MELDTRILAELIWRSKNEYRRSWWF